MVTVSIKDEYIEVLSALGDLQESMDLALKQYTLDKIALKITVLIFHPDLWKRPSVYRQYSTILIPCMKNSLNILYVHHNQ